MFLYLNKLKFLLLVTTTFLFSYEIKFPNLDINEFRFKPLNTYKFEDFKIKKSIKYFELMSFKTKEYTGYRFELEEPFSYNLLLSVGDIPKSKEVEQSREILAKLILNTNYFWKWQEYPSLKYRYILFNFFEKRDRRMKAIENKEELKKILRKIDTPAELLIWIKANKFYNSNPYSYLKIGSKYRVRFFDVTKNGCHIKEYFEFYNKDGDLIASKLLRNEDIKGCNSSENNNSKE